jgi:hypothetical protein
MDRMGGGGSECGIKAAVGALVGTRLDRQDLRLQRHEGREVCTAGLVVVRACAVGEQACVFLGTAVFPQEVPRVPAGSAVQDTPVLLPVGAALDVHRSTVGLRVHADARVAVGVAAGEDCAVTISEDAVGSLGGAAVRAPPEINSLHSLDGFLRAPKIMIGSSIYIRQGHFCMYVVQ